MSSYTEGNDWNVDFDKVRKIMTTGYNRVKNLPSAGFTAGPCLLKDTMQLNAFNNNDFLLGHASMIINEGFPNYLVRLIKSEQSLINKNIGILGMAYKADVDDIRDSLSYKLKKILIVNRSNVYCSDEHIKDKSFLTLNQLLKKCSIIIIGVPHKRYKKLKFKKNIKVYDVWNCLKYNK